MLGANNSEVQIKDVDVDVNEQEKARELGMEIPEGTVSAGGNVAQALSQQVNSVDYGMNNEEEEDKELMILLSKGYHPLVMRKLIILR